MTHFAQQIPAWALTRLPVQWARKCAHDIATVAAPTEQATLQLLVDVSVIHQSDARTGIQRVVRALLLQLLQAPPTGYRVCPVFATRQHGYRYAASNFLDVSQQALTASEHTVRVQSGDLFLALDLAAHLLPRHQTQVLHWKRCGVQLHVVVYDLLPLQHPEWFNTKTTRNFARWIRWLAVYADSTICISETVKVDLHNWLKTRFDLSPGTLPASTIVLGADIDASAPSAGLPANAEALLAHLRNTPAVLMVGTLEPRKGYDQAVAAMELLWQQSDPAPSLVLVGRTGWKTEALQKKLRHHAEAGKRLFWPENVSDEFLAQLYDACSGVLVASRAEGFGLPLIEAALYKKPVLARDLPVFREIGVSGITFFSGDDADTLARAISTWLGNEGDRNDASLHHSVTTWQTAAKQLLHALSGSRKLNPSHDDKQLAQEPRV